MGGNHVDPQVDSAQSHSQVSAAGNHGAGNWFDRANEKVHAASGGFYNDNDPPFFIAKSQDHDIDVGLSDSSSSRCARSTTSDFSAPKVDLENDSCYRDVIDDLTVENKHLKQQLKIYRELSRSDFDEDRLFEVNTSGLPLHKKRELEQVMKKFVLSLDNGNEGISCQSAASKQDPTQRKTIRLTDDGSYISSASNSRIVDSAYGSMSCINLTGQNSCPTLKPNLSRNDCVIPERMAPKNQLPITEKAKMKVVVKRLENIFTGKEASLTGHDQSLRQRGTSKHSSVEGKVGGFHGKNTREGCREAKISLTDFSQDQSVFAVLNQSKDCKDMVKSLSEEEKESGSESLEQRPTRPSDIDLNRAQVPADNLKYMRHLGLAAPEDASDVPATDEDGWIYLNLLSNMAQLHTLNVTPKLVRKAVSKISAKFELSENGKKIRWKGGKEGTEINGGDVGVHSEDEENNGHGPFVRSNPLSSAMSETSPNDLAQRKDRIDRFAYRPIVVGRMKSSYKNILQSFDDDGSVCSWPTLPESTSNFDTNFDLTLERANKIDNKSMVFFKNLPFFKDFSGDDGFQLMLDCETNTCRDERQILGLSQCMRRTKRSRKMNNRRLLSGYDGACESENTEQDSDDPIGDGFRLQPLQSGLIEDKKPPKEFKVSGIAGIYPADNFAIDVQVRHKYSPATDGHASSCTSQIVSTSTVDLLPSRVPPPFYMLSSLSSSGDDDDEDEYIRLDDTEKWHSRFRKSVRSPAPFPHTVSLDNDEEMLYRNGTFKE